MAPNNQDQEEDKCNVESENYFSAEKFVNDLLTHGNTAPCDNTCDAFNNNTDLPTFYDKSLYKSGQKFYYKHIFALFLSKLFGLIAVLAIPTINSILRFTNQSSSEYKSYRRYMSTIFHMCIWYDEDFTPGSRLWQSVIEVRRKHNSASNRGCCAGISRITQKDMALTQFGFMGIALTKKEKVGIFYTTEEEWKAFIHIWRVVGYLMGIEDRFNICRESVSETKEICEILIDKLFVPEMEKKNETFLEMAEYLINGMWCFNPNLEVKVFMTFLYKILTDNNQNNNDTRPTPNYYFDLNKKETKKLNFLMWAVSNLKWTILRVFHNTLHKCSIWLMKVFPFLAYYKFGRAKSYVHILENHSN